MHWRTRKIISSVFGTTAVIATLVAATAIPSAAASRPFPDVSPSSPFTGAISWLHDEGITTGYTDGTFRPRNKITREAMAAYLYRLNDPESYTAPKTSPFPDVKRSDLFYTEVSWLESTGITTGYTDGTFRPRNKITREAMAAFLHRYAKKFGDPQGAPSKNVGFLDIAGNGFESDITWLAAEGISTGWDAGSGCSTYRPRNKITREAMAAFLYRFSTGDGASSPAGDTCSPPPRGHGSLSGNAGTVRVGSAIRPGTYQSTVKAGDLCYWARLSGTSTTYDITANDIASHGKMIVTIDPDDKYFETQHCGTWRPVPAPGKLTSHKTISGKAGVLQVGHDVRPGTYESTVPSSKDANCYWERMSGFGGDDTIIDNDVSFTPGAHMVVTISNNDLGFTTRGCGTWRLTD